MAATKQVSQPKERRISNVGEVVLGFGKKQNLDESRRCPQCAQPSCLPACPLGIDIPGFIRLLREDDATAALERIVSQNPFPAICGRICPAPCEPACIFHEDSAAISIRALERYAADFGKIKFSKEKNTPSGKTKKIAIVGSGPSGMSAAYFLAAQGFDVTIFESCDEPGGILRYGIPEFRLPEKVLSDQFALLENMGVKLVTNALIGSTMSVRDIFGQGHKAILLTLGAGKTEYSHIPGHDLGGVYYAQEFLMRAQMVTKNVPLNQNVNIFYGTHTVVIGGGSAALDAARLAIRLGQKVHLIFEGYEEQMNVRADDLSMAIEEGMNFQSPVKALSIEPDHLGFVNAVKCQALEASENVDQIIPAQTVILAHAHRPNNFLQQHLPQLRFDEDGSIWVDPSTGLTSMEQIFAAGSVVTGAGNVVDAIASGKEVAQKIAGFLNQ